MKLVVNLTETLVGRVREAVERGGYKDAREFVTTAIENQLELEEGDEGDSYRTLDEAIAGFDHDRESREPESVAESVASDGLGRLEYTSVRTVDLPNQNRLTGGPLWGQYNRIFPVKLVVRRLANVLQRQNEEGIENSQTDIQWVDLEQFSEETATVARNYGLQIKEADERFSRPRGEKLASGLPTGDDAEKSKDRFETHFVGYSDRNDKLTGAPVTLKFVDITSEDVSRIGITDAGLTFARATNPLLDRGPDAERALSDDECEFYLDHVREFVSGEYTAMRRAAVAIEEEDNRPESLTERLADIDPDWSDAQANTVRSGLVSRMYELGLLERSRVGQRGIAYEVTDRGRELLDGLDDN